MAFSLVLLAYANDAAGRRCAVTRSGAAFGALDGATDAYGYNGRSEVISARRTLSGDEVRGFGYDYAYDPIGNRIAASYYDEQGEEAYSDYEANALNQYVWRTVPGNVQVRGEADAGATVTVNGNPTWRNGEYFYGGDYADNSAAPVFRDVEIAAVVPAQTPDGYDEIDAVTGRVFVAQTPETFEYDADGNMTCDGRFRYTWNGENRLVRAQELVAPTNRSPYTIAYAYDHKGRMVSKRITENDGQDTLVKSIAYLWDGWNIIREVQWSGVGDQGSGEVLVTDNVWGLDLDGTLQGAGGVGGLLAVVRDDGVFLPTYDANGNVSEYISTDGSIVAHYDYSPFGETLIESGDLASTFTHRFSTKPWCQVTGLYEYQMRKYRTEIGRWLSRDTIGETGALNLYLCAENSLENTWDILGNISYGECFSYCVAYSATQLASIVAAAFSMVVAAETLMELPAGSKAFNLGLENVTSIGNKIYQISKKIANSDGTCAIVKTITTKIGGWARTSGTFTRIPGIRNKNYVVKRFAKAGRTLLRAARGGLVILTGAAGAIEAFCATRCLSCEAREEYEQLMEESPEDFMLGLEDLLLGE